MILCLRDVLTVFEREKKNNNTISHCFVNLQIGCNNHIAIKGF